MAVYSPKRHKHKNSNVVEDLLGHQFQEGVEETQLQALISGSTNSANITMRKTPSKNLDDKSINEYVAARDLDTVFCAAMPLSLLNSVIIVKEAALYRQHLQATAGCSFPGKI